MVLNATIDYQLKKEDAADFLKDKNFAVVVSQFNAEVCDGLLSGALQTLEEYGVSNQNIKVLRVPGAFELPVVAKKITDSKKYAGIICLGCVVRGETPHFEFVSLASTMGCLQTSLEGTPIGFGLLTVDNNDQARARSAQDENNKGRESVLAVFETLKTLEQI